MKIAIKKLALGIITSLTVFTSCQKPADSKDVKQDKIYAEYELFYDKNADKTYASASFRFNDGAGTPLTLSSPSEIKFNNDAIPFDPIFNYYRKEYAGQINSGTFNFKDADGTNYSNLVNIAKIITNPTIDTIKRVGAYTYNWIGDSVVTYETVGLTIGNNANTLNFQVFLQNTVNSKNIVLPLNQLNQLPIGMSYCILDRQIEKVAPNVTSAGGKIRGKYWAMNKNLYVK